MKLQGQHGYAMVSLLVGLSVAAVLMTATMPVWNQAARREKEAELIFRGEQYARAIRLFQRRAGPGVLPPNIDVLVQQKHLRKKYKDPITGEDFQLLSALTPAVNAAGGAGRGNAAGFGATSAVQPSPQRGGGPGASTPGGIMGVASKSEQESLRIYNGRTHYNEWQFVYLAQNNSPGRGGRAGSPQIPGGGQAPGPGGVGPGGRGGRGNGPATPGSGGRGPFTPGSGSGPGGRGAPPDFGTPR